MHNNNCSEEIKNRNIGYLFFLNCWKKRYDPRVFERFYECIQKQLTGEWGWKLETIAYGQLNPVA